MNINFRESCKLKNEFVRLSPLESYHFDDLLDFSINEHKLWKYNLGGANGSENFKKHISSTIEQRKNKKEYFSILLVYLGIPKEFPLVGSFILKINC
ncbi:hypothetical protein [uncultured Winogradskyella sp.]|uniref:hypothetical protein n=1 Tax=uncultured Winogradskyella sp. TaxID=395353 RepID=UPI002624922D|nr:hypothetical protein [uncultured Winogradskyella sp.]